MCVNNHNPANHHHQKRQRNTGNGNNDDGDDNNHAPPPPPNNENGGVDGNEDDTDQRRQRQRGTNDDEGAAANDGGHDDDDDDGTSEEEDDDSDNVTTDDLEDSDDDDDGDSSDDEDESMDDDEAFLLSALAQNNRDILSVRQQHQQLLLLQQQQQQQQANQAASNNNNNNNAHLFRAFLAQIPHEQQQNLPSPSAAFAAAATAAVADQRQQNEQNQTPTTSSSTTSYERWRNFLNSFTTATTASTKQTILRLSKDENTDGSLDYLYEQNDDDDHDSNNNTAINDLFRLFVNGFVVVVNQDNNESSTATAPAAPAPKLTHVIMDTKILRLLFRKQQQQQQNQQQGHHQQGDLLKAIIQAHCQTLTYLKLGSREKNITDNRSFLEASYVINALLAVDPWKLCELELNGWIFRGDNNSDGDGSSSSSSSTQIELLAEWIQQVKTLKQVYLLNLSVDDDAKEDDDDQDEIGNGRATDADVEKQHTYIINNNTTNRLDPLIIAPRVLSLLDEFRISVVRRPRQRTSATAPSSSLVSPLALELLLQVKKKWWRLGLEGLGLTDDHIRILCRRLGNDDGNAAKVGDLLALESNPGITSSGYSELTRVFFVKQRMGLIKVDNKEWERTFDLVRSMNNLHGRLEYMGKSDNRATARRTYACGCGGDMETDDTQPQPRTNHHTDNNTSTSTTRRQRQQQQQEQALVRFVSRERWMEWLAKVGTLNWEDDQHKLNYIWYTLREQPDMITTTTTQQ